MMISYQIIKSRRKSVCIEIRENGEVIVRCPLRYPEREVEKWVEKKKGWIEKKQKEISFRPKKEYGEEEISALKKQAREYLIPKTKEFAEKFGFSYTRVTITKAKKRFGSCSGKCAISYSCYLMLYPKEAIDYVVLHELCHTKHHDHSPRFYALLDRLMPDHRERRKLLR